MADDITTDIYHRVRKSKLGWFGIALAILAAVAFAVWNSLPDDTKTQLLDLKKSDQSAPKIAESDLKKSKSENVSPEKEMHLVRGESRQFGSIWVQLKNVGAIAKSADLALWSEANPMSPLLVKGLRQTEEKEVSLADVKYKFRVLNSGTGSGANEFVDLKIIRLD